MSYDELKRKLFEAMATVLEVSTTSISDETPLIGQRGAQDSMKLVELCLSLEDIAADQGFDFDWTSDAAMSKSRSMFRTAGALATEFFSQMANKK
jgi:hypothetical protein